MKDQLQPPSGNSSSNFAEVDQTRIRKVLKTLGHAGVALNQEQLQLIGQKISEIDEIVPPTSHELHGEVIDMSLVFRLNQCVRRLPPDTELKDLHFWRHDPFKVPAWASLMLDLNPYQTGEIAAILGYIRRKIGLDLSLKDLPEISLAEIKGLGIAREVVAQLVFQNPQLDLADLQAETYQEIEDKLRRMIKIPGENRTNRSTKRQTPLITFANIDFLRSPLPQVNAAIEVEKDQQTGITVETTEIETRSIEWKLWQYAVDNDLISKIVGRRGLSSEEIAILEKYFSKLGGRRPGKTLLDKFSIAVANFA